MELKEHIRRLLEFQVDSLTQGYQNEIELAKNGSSNGLVQCLMTTVDISVLVENESAHAELKAFIGHVLGECPPEVKVELTIQIAVHHPDLLNVLL